jgi:catechol 2,3-dioxygenase-like lactoylglutathione lyase family enzyme
MTPIKAKYVHTNLIARDWQKLSRFYQEVLGCKILTPERHYKGTELERGTGISGSELHGVHLRLPGYGDDGPTLEIYSYSIFEVTMVAAVNRPGFTHIAFSVANVKEAKNIVIQAGGRPLGDVVTLQTTNGDRVTWCYVRDLEGNIIELQSWDKSRV